MWSTLYFCWIFIKPKFSWQIVEKFSNIKHHQNPPSGRWVVLRGETNRQTDRHRDGWSWLFAILPTHLKRPPHILPTHYITPQQASKKTLIPNSPPLSPVLGQFATPAKLHLSLRMSLRRKSGMEIQRHSLLACQLDWVNSLLHVAKKETRY
jgi:hypothetical protein